VATKKKQGEASAKSREAKAKSKSGKSYLVKRAKLKSLPDETLKQTFTLADPNAFTAKGDPPDKFSDEQLQVFEDLVAVGTAVRKICQKPGWPSEPVIWRAIADEGSKVSAAYARGKDLGVARLEEEIISIAETPMRGVLKRRYQSATALGVEDLEEEKEYDMIEHRRMLIDQYKWKLAHVRPKKHGKQAMPDDGDGGLKDLLTQFRQRNTTLEGE
jgi:hypothetical protein